MPSYWKYDGNGLEFCSSNSKRSPRLKGMLQLQQNPWSYSYGKCLVSEQDAVFVDHAGNTSKPPIRIEDIWRAPDYDRTTDLRDDCMNEILSKLGNIQVDLATDIAERQSTIDMVAERVGQLAKAARALRTGNAYQFQKALGLQKLKKASFKEPKTYKQMSNLWLEYRYGWLPLYSDIHELCQFKPKDGLLVRTSRHDNWAETQVTDSGGILATATWSYSSRVTMRAFVKHASSLSTAHDLGLTNPLNLAWELTPYSFVVDWFLPVGAYLQGLTALQGLTLSDSSVTITKTSHCRRIFGTSANMPRTFSYGYHGLDKGAIRPVWSHISGSQRASSKTINRTGLSVYHPLPKLKNPLTINHFLDGLALLTTSLYSKFKK